MNKYRWNLETNSRRTKGQPANLLVERPYLLIHLLPRGHFVPELLHSGRVNPRAFFAGARASGRETAPTVVRLIASSGGKINAFQQDKCSAEQRKIRRRRPSNRSLGQGRGLEKAKRISRVSYGGTLNRWQISSAGSRQPFCP